MAQGYHYCTGIRPKCLEALESAGEKLSNELFERKMLTNYSRPEAHR